MRHWYNFVDIFNSDHAPAVKYTKILTVSYFYGTLYSVLGGYRSFVDPQTNLLYKHKSSTSKDYVKAQC